MMKKIYFLIFIFIISMTVTAYAEGETIVDNAKYLTASEKLEIEAQLDAIKSNYSIDAAIVTVESLGGKTARDYADDYYDYNGYGLGVDDDGILFLICKETREFHITTHALAIDIFTESALDYLESEVVSELVNDNYYEAFIEFAETVDEIVYAYYNHSEVPYETTSSNSVNDIFVLYAFIIAIIMAATMTKKAYNNMNTARKGTDANLYVKQGSMNVTRSNDIFLYSNLVKTKIESSSSSRGGRTHRSSSGRSHGGRGGRF